MTDTTFTCMDCGAQVTFPATLKDDDTISCGSCNRVFGTFAQIKKGILDTLIENANLPPWIRRES